MNAELRRREIVMQLYQRRHDTMDHLAREFHVTVRTIRNDIQILSLSHPILTSRGNQGGISIMDGCYSDRRYLSESEKDTLESLCAVLEGKRLADVKAILRKFAMPQPH